MIAMLALGGAVAPVAAYEDDDLPVEDTLEVDEEREHSQILITAAEEGDLDVTVDDDAGEEVHSETFEDIEEHETVAVDVSDADTEEFDVTVDETHPHSMTLVYTGEEYTVEVDEDDTASQVFAEFDSMTDISVTVEAEDEDEETVTVVDETHEHVHIGDDEDVGAAELDVDGEYDEYTLLIEHDEEPTETGYLTSVGGGAFAGDGDYVVEALILAAALITVVGFVASMRED